MWFTKRSASTCGIAYLENLNAHFSSIFWAFNERVFQFPIGDKKRCARDHRAQKIASMHVCYLLDAWETRRGPTMSFEVNDVCCGDWSLVSPRCMDMHSVGSCNIKHRWSPTWTCGSSWKKGIPRYGMRSPTTLWAYRGLFKTWRSLLSTVDCIFSNRCSLWPVLATVNGKR